MKVGRAVRVLVATALASSLLASASASVLAGGVTRYVDDDGHAGPGCNGSGPAVKKVQKAVKVSGPGDTILVCPGNYRGRVLVGADGNGITIRGPNHGTATLLPPLVTPRHRGSLRHGQHPQHPRRDHPAACALRPRTS